jgi:hypothetical protein
MIEMGQNFRIDITKIQTSLIKVKYNYISASFSKMKPCK